ncbi:acyl-CoA dehydratase activase [bacterium]
MPNSLLHIGVDIGSVSLKMAMMGHDSIRSPIPDYQSIDLSEHPFWLSPYIRHQGDPLACFHEQWKILKQYLPSDAECAVYLTGRGGKVIAKQLDLPYIQEFQAVAESIGRLYPDVNTIFEMGGETAKFLEIRRENGHIQILDYQMNGECAAGTGSFFDQQADRLKYKVEDVGQVIQKACRTACIAGRCSVFAKSDMIHAQQRGYQPEEILKGLCDAVVRNFKGTVTKGKEIREKVAFIGGMAGNTGVVNALRPLFGFMDGELVIPEPHAWMSAVGAAMVGSQKESLPISTMKPFSSKHADIQYPAENPLSLKKVRFIRDDTVSFEFPKDEIVDAYLGIDVGSVSTNLALITIDGHLIHGIYRMTEGRPIDVVKSMFQEIMTVAGDRTRILGVGTTGSGRELIGLLVGADVIKDEITAHKTGAIHISQKHLNQTVDTIFEIGGQDSKFISIRDGVVVDFALNDACAAGTGSFLEEQANQIGIQIKDEFARLALQSEHPLKLGERCTVFMEKEMIPYLRRGIPKKDIVAGLAISVVQNYLNRVVKKRPIGDLIFFQGGTAYNDAVAAAFSTVLDKEIVVPPHNGIMGAIGAALLAQSSGSQESTFRGWNLSKVHWQLREFICKACTNECTIQEFDIEGEKSYWGDKCSDRYRKQSKSKHRAAIPDLFGYRETMTFPKSMKDNKPSLGTVAIPKVLQIFDRFPFWQAYFQTLGFEIRLSESTHQNTIHRGLETTVAEPCFPIQVTHGHLAQLLDSDATMIFLPNMVNERSSAETVASYICPWAQTSPLVAEFSPLLEGLRERLFTPNVQFRMEDRLIEKSLYQQITARFNIKRKQHQAAFNAALNAQNNFIIHLKAKGCEVFQQINHDGLCGIVLIGRSYNLYDSGLNLNIPGKLRNHYGMNVIPMDFLPIEDVDISEIHDHMFWNYGYRILQAARWTRDYSNLQVIYLSNFKCGPDSYIRHFVDEALGRPFLFLQLDSHSNDAGIMTRIEAFLESKGMI